MNIALVCDVSGERDVPVVKEILGRPMAVYPIMAAKGSKALHRVYLATHAQEVKSLAVQHQCIIMDPPAGPVPTPEFLENCLKWIAKDLARDQEKLELVAVLFTHAPGVTANLIDEAAEMLTHDKEADSAVTVSLYNHWGPAQALRESDDGWLEPLVPEAPEGDVWFPDQGLSLVRARALEALGRPGPARRWLGRRILPLKQRGATPVFGTGDAAAMAAWLREHGVPDASEAGGLKPQPKPLPSPKGDRR